MAEWFEFNIAYLLPLFIGFWRWGAFFVLKAIPALFYRPYPLNYRHSLKITRKDTTMIIPVYMPEPGFKQCVRSWIKAKPKKIVIMADKIKGYKEVMRIVNELEHDGVIIQVIPEEKPGKRVAMYDGLSYVDTEIAVFADDDALYEPKLLKSLIQPFKDPEIGGVGTRQVARPKYDKWDVWDIVMDMRLFQRYIEIRATSAMDGGASCLSGRTMAYRTKLFKPTQEYYETTFKEAFLNERFMGKLQLSGDDKCLTRLCINSDYKMHTQISYDCTLSTQFEKGQKLLKQILRWSRNTWRSDFKLLFIERKVWCKYPRLTLVILDKIVSPFTMVLGPFIVLISMFIKQNSFILIGFIIYVLITRTVKCLMYFFYGRPRPPLWWIIFIPHFTVFQYFSAVFRIWALFTLNNYRWGNRLVTVSKKTGQVARMDENGKSIIEKDKAIIIDIKTEPKYQKKMQQNDIIIEEEPKKKKYQSKKKQLKLIIHPKNSTRMKQMENFIKQLIENSIKNHAEGVITFLECDMSSAHIKMKQIISELII